MVEIEKLDAKAFKQRRQFLIFSSLLALFVFAMTYWNGDSLTLALLKSAFSPIFILAVQQFGKLWPRSANDSFLYILVRNAVDALPIAFFFLVSQVAPDRSIDSLASSFVWFYLVFFIGGTIFQYLIPTYRNNDQSA